MVVGTRELASDTKERILEAAERLFTEKGFVGASLRAVTSAAGVNLAAVNYHFGSKEGLLHAVLDRRVGPVNRVRLERLEQLESQLPGCPPSVSEILDAFVGPALVRPEGAEGARLRSLLGRIYGEPPELVGPLLEREFAEVGRRFLYALARALPELPQDELRWRFQLVLGALLHVISGNATLASGILGSGPLDVQDVHGEVLRFLTAGMQASPRGCCAAPRGAEA